MNQPTVELVVELLQTPEGGGLQLTELQKKSLRCALSGFALLTREGKIAENLEQTFEDNSLPHYMREDWKT